MGDKTIPDSAEPRLESFYPPFIAGIDLPHQGVVDSYNLVVMIIIIICSGDLSFSSIVYPLSVVWSGLSWTEALGSQYLSYPNFSTVCCL